MLNKDFLKSFPLQNDETTLSLHLGGCSVLVAAQLRLITTGERNGT